MGVNHGVSHIIVCITSKIHDRRRVTRDQRVRHQNYLRVAASIALKRCWRYRTIANASRRNMGRSSSGNTIQPPRFQTRSLRSSCRSSIHETIEDYEPTRKKILYKSTSVLTLQHLLHTQYTPNPGCYRTNATYNQNLYLYQNPPSHVVYRR